MTGRYTGIYLRKNCAVPFRYGYQLHKFYSRNTIFLSQWIANKRNWQTATPPRTVVLPGDTRAKHNLDPFAILRAAVFASSVAGAVEACPSAFFPPSPYKPLRFFFPMCAPAMATISSAPCAYLRTRFTVWWGFWVLAYLAVVSIRRSARPWVCATWAAGVIIWAAFGVAKRRLRRADGEAGGDRCVTLNHMQCRSSRVGCGLRAALVSGGCVASSQNIPATILLTVASEQFRAHQLLNSGLCDGIPRYRHTRGSRV